MIWSMLAFALAGVCKAGMDASADGAFPYEDNLNKHQTAHQKYKDGNPSLGPRFAYIKIFGVYLIDSRSTAVFLTDFWHFTQMLFLTFVTLAVVTYEPIFKLQSASPLVNRILDFLLMGLILRAAFVPVYKRLKGN